MKEASQLWICFGTTLRFDGRITDFYSEKPLYHFSIQSFTYACIQMFVYSFIPISMRWRNRLNAGTGKAQSYITRSGQFTWANAQYAHHSGGSTSVYEGLPEKQNQSAACLFIVKNWLMQLWSLRSPKVSSWQAQDPQRADVSVGAWRQEKTDVLAQGREGGALSHSCQSQPFCSIQTFNW